MSKYFENIPEIKFEGSESTNPLSFKFYDEKKNCFRQNNERTSKICDLLLAFIYLAWP